MKESHIGFQGNSFFIIRKPGQKKPRGVHLERETPRVEKTRVEKTGLEITGVENTYRREDLGEERLE